MQEKIRVGNVSYLNTRPLVQGLYKLSIADKIELVETYPSQLAEMLHNNEIDIGLVPVAVLPVLNNFFINGNFCIGAEGDVASVCLFSDVPLQEIERVYLDYQSRSSVALLKYLLKYYWKITPELIDGQDETFVQQIGGRSAGLIIGDRCLRYRGQTNFIYDLAGTWKAATGLPFVFAAWVSTHEIAADFIAEFDAANAWGLQHLEEVTAQYPYPYYDLKYYYEKNLSYDLNAAKRQGLDLFLKNI